MKTGHSKIETGHLPANDGKTGQHRSKTRQRYFAEQPKGEQTVAIRVDRFRTPEKNLTA